ncbi:MAG TPA: cyclic nucleotide-binding domain-containing protein [Solirubrobacteraceae bacterium]|nr:cyclic nucleotide-binding domain-containing protein [Solirubrobacteraceae bacterium]
MTAGPRVSGGLAKLLAAELLVSTGSWGFAIALAVSAQERGGAGAVGLLAGARLLPAMLAAPVVGRLLDRVDRSRVVALSGGVEAVCFGTAALLMLTGAPLALIALATVCGSTTASAPRPALESLIPALATHPDEVTRTSAHWAAAENGGALIGSGIGGVAIALVGPGVIALVAAGSLAAAALLASTLPRIAATRADAPEGAGDPAAGWLAGLRAVAVSPLLRGPFALFVGMVLIEGTTDVQLVTLAIRRLHLGAGGPGALLGVWALAGALSGIALVWLTRRRGFGLVLGVGGIALAAGIAVCGLGGPLLALAAMAPAGLGFALGETAIMAVVPRLADDAIVGRVYGLTEMLYTGGAGFGALLAPGLIRFIGLEGSLLFVGGGLLVVTLLLLPVLARLDAHQDRAGAVRALLHGIPCLGALPLPRLERLVQEAGTLHLPAGATIIRRGEPGDAFYAIEHGQVEVVEAGRRQGPGSGFGEIALLRDLPRTATVRCVTDTDLLVIDRHLFLAAVTASGDAIRLADAMIAERSLEPALPA